ncbi:Rho termination factor N-terminal domain-containing protein [Chromohalobacter nigrandesensis]|uniref:Rho termination factor N-terminal domain-containing protein n=1 Tax=Chromohalobacter nigrandesensis TaxID=119863 RepID=UPI001FF67F90|nr:Rho termination factor N-terminal domain-containing protein [Chromohalobacter nigrandesensis]MCK0743570.1 Rho termination factor N-terminal domain-containing protein [Chromohalobacter nigrandesensis]
MSKKTKTVDIECTSAFMAAGKMIIPKKIVRGVPAAEADNLLRRGKAKLIGNASDEDDGEKALEDMTVAELKEEAKALDIEGFDGMQKADLVAAIEKAEEEGDQ